MADNYSQFSEVFVFKTEEAARMYLGLAAICDALEDEDIAPEDLEDLEGDHKDMASLWSFVTLDRRTALLEAFECGRFEYEPEGEDPCAVWVYANEHGNLDALSEIAREVLAFTDDHDTVFTLTWCDYCSKLRPGEFGGGWLVIHAGGVEYGNAHDAAKSAAGLVQAQRKVNAIGDKLDAAIEDGKK